MSEKNSGTVVLTGSVDKVTKGTFRFAMDGEEVRPGVIAPPAATTIYVAKWAMPSADEDTRIRVTIEIL